MTARRVVDYTGPMLGEPLPLELANTTFAVRGQPQDGLRSVEHFMAWLTRMRARLETPLVDEDLLAANRTQLALIRDLRDCVHRLATAAVGGVGLEPAVLDRLNRHVRVAPRWTELRWGERPYTETCSNAPPVTTAICEIAVAAVELFSSPQRAGIRPCHAPGCVLHFLKDHPRREWCSTACGNRVRAARHYERRRKQHG